MTVTSFGNDQQVKVCASVTNSNFAKCYSSNMTLIDIEEFDNLKVYPLIIV